MSPAGFLFGEFHRPVVLIQEAVVTREVVAVADAAGTLAHLTDATVPSRRSLSDMLARAASWDEGQERQLAEATTWSGLMNYPPLYYATVGGVLAVERTLGVNAIARFYSARLATLALFLLALVAAAAALARLDVAPAWRTGTLAAIALHPQLSMLSVSVQPDILGLLLVTLALGVLVEATGALSVRRAVTFGVLLGAIALTKPHYAPPLAAAALVWAAWSKATGKAAWLEIARVMATSTLVALAVGGWWFLRSRLLFDNWMGLVGWLPGPAASTWGSNLATWWHLSLPMTFRSYWGVWGWFDYGVPEWMVGPLFALSVLPAILLVAALVARGADGPLRTALGPRSAGQVLVLAAAGLVFLAEMIAIGAAMGMVQAQGRHWLAFVLPQALYLCAPVALLGGPTGQQIAGWSHRHARPLWVAGVVALAVALLGASASVARLPAGWVDLQARVTGDGLATLFSDSGPGFNTAERATVPLRRRDGTATTRFPLYGAPVFRLRLDVTASAGTMWITAATLTTRGGTSLPIALDRALARQGVERLARQDRGVSITPLQGSTAILEMPLDGPAGLQRGGFAMAQRALWAFWGRAWRRWPAAEALLWLWPTALAIAVLAFAGRRAGHTLPPRTFGAWPVVWASVIAGVMIGLDLWLAVETWIYYS